MRGRPTRSRARRGDLEIVYEDADLVVLNKPAGLLAVPLPLTRREGAVSVYDLLKEYLRSHKRKPLVVHRIDRDTSGLVVFVKNAVAQERLKEQFQRREPERVYLAVVHGHPESDAGTWSDHLAWDQRALIQKKTHERDRRAKEAISEYRVLERFDQASLLEVRLRTGKRNQIRVQAGLRGFPLVGEQRYVFGHLPRVPVPFHRQALHACRLRLRHPRTGQTLEFEAPLPQDMNELMSRLRGGATTKGH